ncbi:hypothetical protein HK100_007979 [Physocladia obscura]|uniref:Clp R domain-containing protein n=1 Tax=Physocladia obscura TaxID=109957 RepID=A0AAD5SR44_9FUNG|nr:hypothetical protein HK100_007979 [Physocladia obscura]
METENEVWNNETESGNSNNSYKKLSGCNTTIKTYEPHTKRGRRKTDAAPASNRQAYMRQQQRSYRQRKQNYIDDLELRCRTQAIEINSLRAKIDGVFCTNNTNDKAAPADPDLGSSRTYSESLCSFESDSPTPPQLPPASNSKTLANCQAAEIPMALNPSCTNPNCAAIVLFLQLEVAQLRIQLSAASAASASAVISGSQQQQYSVMPMLSMVSSVGNIMPSVDSLGSGSLSSMVFPEHNFTTDFDWNTELEQLEQCQQQSTENCLQQTSMLLLTAEEMYGPVDIEDFRTRLKNIPSICQFSSAVDQICFFFVEMTRTTDSKKIRTLLLKLIRISYSLMDLCSICDRIEAIRIITDSPYVTHSLHIHNMCNIPENTMYSTDAVVEAEWPWQVKNLKSALKIVVSSETKNSPITNRISEPVIDSMCQFFAHLEQQKAKPDLFFIYKNILHILFVGAANKDYRAQTEAREFGHSLITPIHILNACMEDSDGFLHSVVTKAGADPDLVSRKLKSAMLKFPSQSPASKTIIFSSKALKVLCGADHLRKTQHDSHVVVDHLLLALLNDHDAMHALNDSGVNKTALKQSVHSVRRQRHVDSKSADVTYDALSKYAIDLVALAQEGRSCDWT